MKVKNKINHISSDLVQSLRRLEKAIAAGIEEFNDSQSHYLFEMNRAKNSYALGVLMSEYSNEFDSMQREFQKIYKQLLSQKPRTGLLKGIAKDEAIRIINRLKITLSEQLARQKIKAIEVK